MNCSLILLPVLWHVLHYAHKRMKCCPCACCRFRIAKKLPLGENVVFHKLVASVGKNDEFCIQNEELCIKDEELCINNEESVFKMMNSADDRLLRADPHLRALR